MSDRISISLWLKLWDEDTTLEAFYKLMLIFPYSEKKPGVRAVTVQPLEWSEPPAYEENFAEGATADEALEAVRQFQHPDCAYIAEVYWDIADQPVLVRLVAYGPDFEGRDEAEGHVEIDLGLDDPYRAERTSVTKLVFLMHELPKQLDLRKRLLSSESGEDVSELLARTIQ